MEPAAGSVGLKEHGLGTATYKVVRCRGCGKTKRLGLYHGLPREDLVQAFEADGWMYKEKSSGICNDCNLFNTIGFVGRT